MDVERIGQAFVRAANISHIDARAARPQHLNERAPLLPIPLEDVPSQRCTRCGTEVEYWSTGEEVRVMRLDPRVLVYQCPRRHEVWAFDPHGERWRQLTVPPSPEPLP